METLNLHNYGVAPLTAREMKTTNGGVPWFRMVRNILAAAAAIHEVVCDGDNHLSPQPDGPSLAGTIRFGE